MNEKSCKWFVTDTLFEWSLIQMMTWINMLMTDSMMNQHESRWKEKKAHQRARNHVWHTMITTWYQSIKVFQLSSYKCEIE